MPRRFAGQVHKQTSRFLRSKLLKHEPAWYQAVLEHPPLPLPPRAPASRQRSFENYSESDPSTARPYDLPRSIVSATIDPTIASSLSRKPLPIRYVEDKLRRQFFKDHPFEAFRPVSIIEKGRIESEHPISGAQWTRLRQRGRSPTAEDCVRFAVNLHEHHQYPLSHAYSSAVAQFRSLRSEHELSLNTARLEADAQGLNFRRTEVEKVFRLEEKALDTWEKKDELDASALAARKRWKAIIEKDYDQGTWSRGKEYVRLWKEGVRPDYLPILKDPIITSAGLESGDVLSAAQQERRRIGESSDYLGLRQYSSPASA